jgi:glycosyltransferase involved in cell wall biosynthesis
MIAKDREATIGKALASVAPYVDELLVVDTGSNDWTVEVAREHGSRVEFFAWCDDFATTPLIKLSTQALMAT